MAWRRAALLMVPGAFGYCRVGLEAGQDVVLHEPGRRRPASVGFGFEGFGPFGGQADEVHDLRPGTVCYDLGTGPAAVVGCGLCITVDTHAYPFSTRSIKTTSASSRQRAPAMVYRSSRRGSSSTNATASQRPSASHGPRHSAPPRYACARRDGSDAARTPRPATRLPQRPGPRSCRRRTRSSPRRPCVNGAYTKLGSDFRSGPNLHRDVGGFGRST
jgi:hypothetical protein